MRRNPYIVKLSTLFLVTMLFPLFTKPLLAAEPLNFDQSPYKSSEILIKSYLQKTLSKDISAFTIAMNDLNHDGLDEFILKPLVCNKKNAPCLHLVIAETNQEIVELGTIQARHITLEDSSTHGIRNVRAYKNETNDYEYDIYVWEPRLSRYIISEQDTGNF